MSNKAIDRISRIMAQDEDQDKDTQLAEYEFPLSLSYPFAVISDVHSNIHAFRAVLVDIEEKGIETIVCLGDIVGYGANPVECIDLTRKLMNEGSMFAIKGNHDEALFGSAEDYSVVARVMTYWTRQKLIRADAGEELDNEFLEFLRGLNEKIHDDKDYLFVHGSPVDPLYGYIFPRYFKNGDRHQQRILENFKLVGKCAFVGHTHVPFIGSDSLEVILPDNCSGVYAPKDDEKLIVNVGSVGQPRDRDPRASYVIVEEDGTIRFVRVSYDFDEQGKALRESGINRSWIESIRELNMRRKLDEYIQKNRGRYPTKSISQLKGGNLTGHLALRLRKGL